MRSIVALAVLTLIGFVALSLTKHETPAHGEPPRPAIYDFQVADPLRVEMDDDPKFASPLPVHIVEGTWATVLARTEGIERLDVLVQLSSSESFGVFSGRPDGDGLVRIEVEVPATGSIHYWRVPGPEGRRTPGPVRPGTVFMLVPMGVAASDIENGHQPVSPDAVTVRGDVLWVKLGE